MEVLEEYTPIQTLLGLEPWNSGPCVRYPRGLPSPPPQDKNLTKQQPASFSSLPVSKNQEWFTGDASLQNPAGAVCRTVDWKARGSLLLWRSPLMPLYILDLWLCGLNKERRKQMSPLSDKVNNSFHACVTISYPLICFGNCMTMNQSHFFPLQVRTEDPIPPERVRAAVYRRQTYPQLLLPPGTDTQAHNNSSHISSFNMRHMALIADRVLAWKII